MEGHMLRAGENIAAGPGNGQDKSGARGPHGPKDTVARPGGDTDGTGKTNTLRTGLDQKGPRSTSASVPITFDHRSQSFMTEHQVSEGRNMRTVTEPVGSFLARSGGSFGGENGAAAGPRGGPGYNPTNGGSPGARGDGLINGRNGPRGGGGFDAAGGGPRGGGNSGGGGSLGGGSPRAVGGGGSSPAGGGGGGGSFGGGGSRGGGGGGSAPAPSPSPK
jgi:hypothetical protein